VIEILVYWNAWDVPTFKILELGIGEYHLTNCPWSVKNTLK
jgi:hypothetical protein